MVCEVTACLSPPQLKELLSERNEGTAVAQICLIFAGKILKDDQTLESQGVKDGLTIHMVIRSGGAKVQCRIVHCEGVELAHSFVQL